MSLAVARDCFKHSSASSILHFVLVTLTVVHTWPEKRPGGYSHLSLDVTSRDHLSTLLEEPPSSVHLRRGHFKSLLQVSTL